MPLVTYRNVKVFLSVLLLVSLVFLFFVAITESAAIRGRNHDTHELAKKQYDIAEATDVKNPHLHYGIVVDCGSSGSRLYVYFWPPHDGNPKELLNIQQMRDINAEQVVKKIEPGISEFADKPGSASDYIRPLLKFAADHIPVEKHKETPLYIMATAGMRMISQSAQDAILEDLRVDIPMEFHFLFSATHVEVITGKQEGVYAWIGVNYALHKFDHIIGDDPMVVVTPIGGSKEEVHVRKRTVGMIDMGGGSVQIAYEVPKSEDVAKSLLAEFNLGCTESDTEHTYRVYVTTFLGYGGNIARTRYEAMMIDKAASNVTSTYTGLNHSAVGESVDRALSDPCLPVDLVDSISYHGRTYYFKGTGDFDSCRDLLRPLLNQSAPCMKAPCSMNGVYQPPIDLSNSEFYGFSEFYYSLEDVLRLSGKYNYQKFEHAAEDYCSTKWSVLQSWYDKNYYPKADARRFRRQCFKSAWIATALHDGFKFPEDYSNFYSTQLINHQEIQWTLGALVFKTRFFPLREIEKYSSHNPARPSWEIEFQHGYYLLILCLSIVICAILVYLRRLRIVQKPDLSRVPTMAYFMTEEGQVEEGLIVDREQGLPSYHDASGYSSVTGGSKYGDTFGNTDGVIYGDSFGNAKGVKYGDSFGNGRGVKYGDSFSVNFGGEDNYGAGSSNYGRGAGGYTKNKGKYAGGLASYGGSSSYSKNYSQNYYDYSGS